MPWLTPDTIPEDGDCRPLFIPASSDWLAIVSGCLNELVAKYNWQQFGAVTVEEAVATMQSMIDRYYDGCSDCPSCELPGGGKIIRINPDSGHVEELGDDGTWQTPSGDYEVPAIPVREDSDPVCLAAANAVNVYQQIYESLTDSFSGELSAAEAYIAMATAFAALVAPEFAPITVAIGAFFLSVFGILYGITEFFTSDLWDAAFTKNLTCVFLQCASNDAGVVTFDFTCIGHELYSQVNLFELNEVQLRLFIQVTYIIQMTGGIDGLNLAGATTAITDYDCDFCDQWCIRLDATESAGGFDFLYAGTWVSGEGIQTTTAIIGGVLRQIVEGSFALGGTYHVVRVRWAVNYVAGSQTTGVIANGLWRDDFSELLVSSDMPQETDPEIIIQWDGDKDVFNLGFDCQAAHENDNGLGTIMWVEVYGDGDKPTITGWTDCP